MSSPSESLDTKLMDGAFMAHVIGLAQLGWGQVAPNPLVGAIVVKDSEMIGSGYHHRFGDPHAEFIALNEAGPRARGATLYVNLEPCNHYGKTPPCTKSIIDAGISRVVLASRDPNPVASGGAERLRSAGITVDFEVCESEAREINAAFFNSFTSDRPWVTLKLAVSLDGSIAPEDRKTAIMTNEKSLEVVHRMRAQNDAIAVGAATAAADDPQLTARSDPPPRVPPTRIVFDRSAGLSSQSKLAKTARQIPTIVVTSETTSLKPDLHQLGVEALPAHDLSDALRKLKARGINSLMVEGGAGLAASFLASGFVDRMVIFEAPIILGNGSLNAFSGIASQSVDDAPRFRVLTSAKLDNDIMTTYAVEKS